MLLQEPILIRSPYICKGKKWTKMRYERLDKTIFRSNRRRFTSEMKPGSMAVFHANDRMPKSGDQYFPFRQQADFFRLTGIDQEDCVLLIFPEAPKKEYREILFIKHTNDHIAVWEGPKLSKEESKEISGIESIYWTNQFEQIFQPLLYQSEGLYLNVAENGRFKSPVKSKDHRFALHVKEQYPLHNLERAQPILHNISMIKSLAEISIMKRACEITSRAFLRVLSVVKPGMVEYELEAEIIKQFIQEGANGHAYEPIIASGESACILHYTQNNREIKDGSLILMDFGADYANFNADLSRTIPANGRFNERQKQVYQATLNVFKAAKAMYLPGQTLAEIQKEVEEIMGHELKNLGLLDHSDDKEAIQKYFMHGVGHHLGIDVHDPSDRNAPLQHGMVITCEPGIYIPEEKLGVRIENDIMISDNGPVDLMADIPIEIEEIEEIMNNKLIDVS